MSEIGNILNLLQLLMPKLNLPFYILPKAKLSRSPYNISAFTRSSPLDMNLKNVFRSGTILAY